MATFQNDRAAMAASNNADLYEAMFGSWRLPYRRTRFAFIGDEAPPPYYSHLTVLTRECQSQIISELRCLAARFDGAIGLKDSYCEYDLQPNGFRTLFEASWIWRAAEAGQPPEHWYKVRDSLALKKWEDAWKRFGSPTTSRMFRDAMLANPKISFWGKWENDDIVAGCIANTSSECVGISNVFSDPLVEDAFQQATAAVASSHSHLPIVGYSTLPRLKDVQPAGYQVAGNLQILAAEDARF